MKQFNNWYPKEETIAFVKQSTPIQNGNLKLYKGEEDVGWVDFYFRYNEKEFKVFVTLAASDLSDLVIFFENIINLKEESAIYLDNETISMPL